MALWIFYYNPFEQIAGIYFATLYVAANADMIAKQQKIMRGE